MSLTLRQLQKTLSRSRRNLGARMTTTSGSMAELIAQAARLATGNTRFRNAFIRNGVAVNSCDCPNCAKVGRNADIQSKVDSWTSKYGPNADLQDVLRAEMQNQQNSQQAGSNDGNQHGDDADPQQQAQDGQGNGTPNNEPSETGNAQPTGSAPNQPATGSAQESAKPALTPEQQALQQAKALVAEAQKAARQQPKNASAKELLARAQRLLKQARKKASFHQAAMASSPSLSARKRLTSAHGRLRRVPQKLRSQMAELINRLVSQAGTTGSQLGPIPVLSARKLVNRMLVQRPLQNALKEDSVSGRPVTLFLPDVSPSCEAQAQIACDLANAASYAGLTGSDVLVLPHANGQVDRSDEYFPWLNGKPITTDVAEIPQIFDDVCGGRSRFTVRVAVFIGDHDAVDHYGSVAALKTVRRAVWLHNYRDSSSRDSVTPVNAGSFLHPGWSSVADKKLSMVAGCTSMSSMLSGFDKAVKQ